MRRRFDLNAVASSDGTRVRISHDRKANTTGRTPYTFCGKSVIITDEHVFLEGRCIGKLFTDSEGSKYVIGPNHKGYIEYTCS